VVVSAVNVSLSPNPSPERVGDSPPPGRRGWGW